MKRILLSAIGISALALSASPVNANTKNTKQRPEDSGKIVVQGVSPGVKLDPFKKEKGIVVREVTELQEAPSALPDRKKRDELFKQVGLEQDVAKFDELDRDLLWGNSKRLPIDQLAKKYPKIDRKKLQQLKAKTSG